MYCKTIVLLLAGSITAWSAGAAPADDSAIPDKLSGQLMQKFADKGIDADGDGVLTAEEVEAFFQGPALAGPRRGGHGPGSQHGGFHGDRSGPHGKAAMLLHRLKILGEDTPPENFDLERFAEADANEDGQLTNAEWATFAAGARAKMLDRLAKRHPKVDQDGDGQISETELDTFREKVMAKVQERVLERHPEADADGDGTLSEEELQAFHESRLEERQQKLMEHHPEADLDGDGEISRKEMRKFRKASGGRFGDGPNRRGEFGGKRGKGRLGRGQRQGVEL